MCPASASRGGGRPAPLSTALSAATAVACMCLHALQCLLCPLLYIMSDVEDGEIEGELFAAGRAMCSIEPACTGTLGVAR